MVFAELLRRIASHFDTTDPGEAFRRLTNFGVSNDTPFNVYLRSFRLLVSSVSGSERAMAPTASAILECIRTSVSNQYPMLMPALFPGHLATQRDPYGSVAQLWLAFDALETNKTLAIRGDGFVSVPSTSGAHPYADGRSSGASARNNGRQHTRQGHQFAGTAGQPIVMNVSAITHDPFTLCYSAWPLDPDHWEEVYAVSASFATDDPPLWTPLVTHADRRQAFASFRGVCLNCGEQRHNMRQCEQPFTNSSGLLNPELGQLNDNGDAFRRWQRRMQSYRRGNNLRSASTQPQHRNSRGSGHQGDRRRQDSHQIAPHYSQDARQGSRHQTNAPLALPAPSTASTSTALVSAPSPAMRYGPTHAANTNPNARQPGTFTTRRN